MIFFLLVLILPLNSFANTQIYLAKPDVGSFSRSDYPEQVLRLALDKTVSDYGEYKITKKVSVTRKRALYTLIEGRLINVHSAPAKQSWENKTIPIYIPIRKGLLGYRLLLINNQNQKKIDNIKNIEDLKKLKCGTGSQWSTTKALSMLDFNLIKGKSYEGLFGMLEKGRFDYFPRGVNEVFGELKKFSKSNPNIKLEEKLAIYLPLPTYLFVSPKYPELAKRIEKGLRMAIKDGSFNKLFIKFQGRNIKKANLSNRKIFRLENPALKKQDFFYDKSLWYTP